MKLINRKRSANQAEVPVEAQDTPLVKVMKSLSECDIGQSGVIRSIGGDGAIRRRLFDMGVTPGAEFYLRKRAPLGDPIEITLRGYELTLRATEASVVTVETMEAAKSAEEAENA